MLSTARIKRVEFNDGNDEAIKFSNVHEFS